MFGGQNSVSPCPFLPGERAARLVQRIFQYFLPACCIVKCDVYCVLDKGGDTRRLLRGYKRAHFFELSVLERYGEFGGRHTKNHTMLCVFKELGWDTDWLSLVHFIFR